MIIDHIADVCMDSVGLSCWSIDDFPYRDRVTFAVVDMIDASICIATPLVYAAVCSSFQFQQSRDVFLK